MHQFDGRQPHFAGRRLRKGRARGHHGFEKRQRHRDAHTTQNRATREVLLRQIHHGLLDHRVPLTGFPTNVSATRFTGFDDRAAVGSTSVALAMRNA